MKNHTMVKPHNPALYKGHIQENITHTYMDMAIKQAQKGSAQEEVPIGAIIVHNPTNTIIAQAHNTCNQEQNPTKHAEILAIDQACKHLNSTYLTNCTIYVTLEPCAMCAMALSYTKIHKIIFGAYDPKSGGIEHGAQIYTHPQTHHKPETIGGIQEQTCKTLLTSFFQSKR